MSDMSFEDAAQSLQTAANQDAATETTPTPGSPAEQSGASPAAPTTGGDGQQGVTDPNQQAAGEADSFTNIDPATLSPELQAIYKQMQGDYTRKTQEIAPYRQLSEAGITPDRVIQSLQFVEALETDPQFVVAVHQQLSSALEQAGLSPQQASQEAQRQIETGEAAQHFQLPEEQDDPRVSELTKELQDLKQWKDQQEAHQVEQSMMADLQRAEMSIRQHDANLTDTDMETIYEMAFAHGGNLIAAYNSFQGLRDRFISSYVDQKGTTHGAAPVATPEGATGHSTEPPAGTPSFKEASAAAKEYLRNTLGH